MINMTSATTTNIKTVEQEYLTTSSARKFLGGVSRDFLDNLRESGQLSYRKVGGMILFRVSDIRKLVEGNKVT